jgi:hypothetical protein
MVADMAARRHVVHTVFWANLAGVGPVPPPVGFFNRMRDCFHELLLPATLGLEFLCNECRRSDLTTDDEHIKNMS